MTIWHHLFIDDLEYAPAVHILSGLTLGHVGKRPADGVHSIYEELFHAAGWQRSMLTSAKGGALTEPTDWPSMPAPDNEAAWTSLVADFLAGNEEAVAVGNETERHGETLPEGRTVRERLELLAVHNAYHLGKIVSARQFLGVWSGASTEVLPENEPLPGNDV